MEKSNIDNFCGTLCNTNGTTDGFFQVTKHDVTIIPLGCDYYISNKHKEDNSTWIYGISNDNSKVAIGIGQKINRNMEGPVDLKAEYFHAPIILKSCSNDRVNINEFDSIEFYGGIVDVLFNPAQVLNRDITTGNISKRNNDEYEKKYNVQVDGETFSVRYSIKYREFLTWEIGKLPDLRNMHSAVYFDFKEKKSISDIFKYYQYAKCLFQFCSGSVNVGFGIRLFINKDTRCCSAVDVKLLEEYDDYAEDRLDIAHVISLNSLGQNADRLFTVLNEKKTEPYMEFLPKRNINANRILSTDISDLCVSLEGEYSKIKTDNNDENKQHARSLADKLLNEIKKEENCPAVVKKKACDIINTQLKSFLPSLKEKISWLYEQYEVYIKTITSRNEHVKLGIVKAYTLSEFKEKISEFVAMRNKASHGGFEFNEGIEIYVHLELLVYFCVLYRAGYSGEESAKILSWLFGHYF